MIISEHFGDYCQRLQNDGALNRVQFFFWATLYISRAGVDISTEPSQTRNTVNLLTVNCGSLILYRYIQVFTATGDSVSHWCLSLLRPRHRSV